MLQLTEDDLLNKHKKERKDLLSQIQSLKKSCTKGDKKKKKEVTETVVRLEQELEDKQNKELEEFQNLHIENNLHSNEVENLIATNETESLEDSQESKDARDRVSKAQKRRNKKAADDKEREERIRAQEEENKNGPRILESETIEQLLKVLGLKLHSVPANGDCLYRAVSHQLEQTGRQHCGVTELRTRTAQYLRQHRADMLPFMSAGAEPLTDIEFEDYCSRVADTAEWGGQLELVALCHVLRCPIRVLQAQGSPATQGENYLGPPLLLTYHRHLYGLGEHYNSTIPL